MGFFWGLIIGAVLGLFLVPIGIYILYRYKETKVRRNIKRMLLNGQILKPMDKRDFDAEMWKDKINLKGADKEIEQLNDRIFKRGKFKPKVEELSENVRNKE